MLDLLRVALPDLPIPLLTIDLANHSISDPFQPREPEELKPTLWMKIPKLPGEAEIERLRANEHRLRQNRSEID